MENNITILQITSNGAFQLQFKKKKYTTECLFSATEMDKGIELNGII